MTGSYWTKAAAGKYTTTENGFLLDVENLGRREWSFTIRRFDFRPGASHGVVGEGLVATKRDAYAGAETWVRDELARARAAQ